MMSGKPHQRRGPESAVQRRLDHQLRQMVDDLRGLLDLDAGLSEIRARRQHEALVQDLRGMLDLDAGLREILGTAAAETSAPGAARPEPADRRIPRPETAAVLGAILTARSSGVTRVALDLLAAARAGDLARVSVCARGLMDALAFDGADAITFARARASSGADAGSLVDGLADALLGIDVFARTRGEAGVDACALACLHARKLASTLDDTRRGIEALDRVSALADARVDAFARVLAEAVSRALDGAEGLANSLADALAGAPTGADGRHSRLADARTQSAAMVSSFLAIIDGVLTHGLSRAIAGIDLKHLPPERIRVLLDDFTHADLSTIDLAGIDLTGLRWSATTQWPPAFVDTVRRHSRETNPGSEVFEVVGDENELTRPR
jgi:hypothetical protein